MIEKLEMYVNGEWVESHSSETIEVMNPSDDSVLGVITAGILMMLIKLLLQLNRRLLTLVFHRRKKEFRF